MMFTGDRFYCSPDNRSGIESTLVHFRELKFNERFHRKDHLLFNETPDETANRMGWLDIPSRMLEKIDVLKQWSDSVCEEGISRIGLVGMGGSSLAPEVFSRIFVSPGRNLIVLDTTDPSGIRNKLADLPEKESLYIISTKSGTTIETVSVMNYLMERTRTCGRNMGNRFIAITDPGSYLEKFGQEHNFRNIFLNDPDIGGRYSALSYVGLVPAALMGCDLRKMLVRAESEQRISMSYDLMVSSHITPLGFGTALGYFARKGIDKMFIIASGAYANIGDWIEQLVAESSGKQGKGILPVIDNEIQLPESFRSDRMYVFIRTQGDSEYDTVISELTESGYPVFVFELRDSYDISAHMYLWEYATAVFCQMLGVNPFDQPDVEAAKKLAREVIETFRKTGRLSDDPPECSDGGLSVFSSMGIESTDKIIPALFADLSSRDYAAILVYADGSDDRVHQVLLELRRCIERRYGIPVTVGFGPRYLHSTGQLHKGDAGLGRFLILTGISDTDIPIPEAAETSRQQVSFGILKRAQSIGDYRALRKAGRKVVRLDAPESSFTQALRMLKMFLL